MKCFIYGHHNIGDKAILSTLKAALDEDTEYLGEKVDLSRIVPEEENLIIIINHSIWKVDVDKVLAYAKKDLSRPLLVVQKKKTFGTVFFNENRKIEQITSNKVFVFAGIMYIPKKYFKTRMSEIFRLLNGTKEEVRIYFT